MSSVTINRAPAAANVTANVSTAQVFPNLITPTIACILTMPGTGRLDGRKFYVRGSGYVTGGTTTNVTIGLYVGTSLTVGSNTLLGASTARAVNSTSAPWFYEAELIVDSVSGKLHGTFKDVINNLVDAPAALSNVVTALTPGVTGAEPVTNFVIAVTFSAANAGNIGNLSEFAVDY